MMVWEGKLEFIELIVGVVIFDKICGDFWRFERWLDEFWEVVDRGFVVCGRECFVGEYRREVGYGGRLFIVWGCKVFFDVMLFSNRVVFRYW